MEIKSFKETGDVKNRILTDEEIIKVIKESLSELNESKYSFFNGINEKNEKEYLYITDDNFIAYYTIPSKDKRIRVEDLTERIKIEDGILYRWDKKKKSFLKAPIVKIEECFLCKIPFFKKRMIERIKKRLMFNTAISNIKNKENIKTAEKVIYGK